MAIGSIVEYIDQSRLVCTVCLQDKGNRLHLLTPANREVNLSPKRTLLVSGVQLDVAQPRDQLLQKLQQIETLRIKLKEEIDVKEVWELIRDEEEVFDHRYLAQLAFGEEAAEEHFSAVVRALFENKLYFKMKNGLFRPNSKDRVEQIIRQEAEAAEKAERLEQGGRWLEEVHQGKQSKVPDCSKDIIQLLIQLALYGADADDFKYGKELLSYAGINDIRQARPLLIALGEWGEDEPLDLMRSGVETAFTATQLEASARLAVSGFSENQREDLRSLPVMTIDGPKTQDFDDAISVEVIDNGLRIGVHIADVAAVIKKDSPVDVAARDRASSLYMPRRQIPMIPEDLSQDLLSLKEGCDRPAISLLARFGPDGSLLRYRFTASMIRVDRKLTYDDVNETLLEETQFRELHRLAERLRQKRMDSGAMNLSLPDLEVVIDEAGLLNLERVPQDSPSRTIVAEFMILYNELAAEFCWKNDIPVLFRAQSQPTEKLPLDERGYVFYVFQQRRKLSPLHISTKPKPHSGLGVSVYIQATSPIRRYLDLVAQRQLTSFLEKRTPLYNGENLEEIRVSVEPLVKALGRIQRNRLRYWTLKYLGMNLGKTFNALILDELKNKYRIVLTDVLLVTDIKRQDGTIFSKGQEIQVKVKKADPWEDVITLEYVSS
ncbi:MAG: RNB domain-containing ribonuclease [Deltaproteobacteria bacterium]|nr:RNB domain-containing ribonuclease [Deltaproteobacteria bacterium]